MQNQRLEYTLIITFILPVLLESLGYVKGTGAYSARLNKAAEEMEKALEQYHSLKIYPTMRKDRNLGVDQNGMGANLVMNCIRVGIAIADQPDHVQHRFNTEFENMLIRYGVQLEEMAETA